MIECIQTKMASTDQDGDSHLPSSQDDPSVTAVALQCEGCSAPIPRQRKLPGFENGPDKNNEWKQLFS